MWNVIFLFQGLIYILLLFIVFKSKKRISSEENIIFQKMTIIMIATFIIEISLQITFRNFGVDNIFTFIFGRIYLVGLYVWYCYLTLYTYYISRIKNINNKEKASNKYRLFKKFLYFIIIVGSILFLILPIYMMSEGENNYSYGPAVNLLKISLVGGIIFWLILLVIYRKNIKQKEFYPIYTVMILLIITVILQTINPSILIATATFAFTLHIMFFTIENPDLRMIEQLELAREHADKANRAKTDFLSSMSHEIRTPLNAISGFSNCILESNSLDEAKENAEDIVDASNTLIEIVNGILDVSKIEAGKMEIVSSPYEAKDVFEELATLITPKMKGKGLDFSYYIAPDIPNVLFGDYANIKKVVTNLLSNACKYTENGFVRYEVNCVNVNNYSRLIISVEDSGRGIKKESIDKMFSKFQRLEEDRNTTIEGTGLGLAITKQLTELMGGKIIVHSVYGKGSKFTVVINQKISNEPIKKERKYKTTLNLKDIKILLVDDNVLNIKVAKKILESFNANMITTCDSGFKCLDIINDGEKFDIILLDDMMPKMSGVDTLRRLKENVSFKTPVIALTANAITGMKEKYLKDGFNNYLSKPIVKEELIKVMNEVLGRVVTEQLPIVNEEDNKDIKEDNNEIIPVDEHIEEELGDKLDLSYASEEKMMNESKMPVDQSSDEELLDDGNLNYLSHSESADTSTDTSLEVDVDYLKENGVDVDHALELLGDMEMFDETVKSFLEDATDKWNRIVEYKNNSDMENYAIEVHSLKSDSKYLGFMTLADLAYQHELKSKDKDIDFVTNHFSELETEFRRVLEVVEKYNNSKKC